MRILIILPRQAAETGNHVTAQRFAAGLRALGHGVVLLPVKTSDHAVISRQINEMRPHVALLLHAYRSGRPWLEAQPTVPFATLLTGTDANAGQQDEEQRGVIEQILTRSRAVLAQNREILRELAPARAKLRSRFHYLPPGFQPQHQPFDLRADLGIDAQTILFLHPAGIRPVKGNLELIDLFSPLAVLAKPFRLAFCGPIIDQAYGSSFLDALAARPWARYAGIVPASAMLSAMRQADVVLNNSHAEGLPNALVEAAALGRPILATAISGNREVVIDEVNGFCCPTPQSFTHRARQLLVDDGLRQRLSRPEPARFDPLTEARTLCAILETIALNPR